MVKLYPHTIAKLTDVDRYRLKNSTAVIFLPDNIKSVFYADMSKNRLNEHLMLNSLMNYVLLETNSDILERLEPATRSIMCEHLNAKIDIYLTTI